MSAGVGMDRRPIERDCAQLQHTHLARQQQHLDEQRFDLRQKALSETGDGVVSGWSFDAMKRNATLS